MTNPFHAILDLITPYIKPVFRVIQPLVLILLALPQNDTDTPILEENEVSIEFILETLKESSIEKEELGIKQEELGIELAQEQELVLGLEQAKEKLQKVFETIAKSYGLNLEDVEPDIEEKELSIQEALTILEEKHDTIQTILDELEKNSKKE